jgi:hypothetical protein
MKVEDLKLYNKYKHINNSDREFIYIGFDKQNSYLFLYKDKNDNTQFSYIKYYGLNPDKIVKDLNLEIGFYKNGDKYIKGYKYIFYSKVGIESFFKPDLKDKLKNILNR